METTTIVTVRVPERRYEHDLECPAGIPVGRILEKIVRQAFASDTYTERNYEVVAEPPGRRLAMDATLEEAGVWDGTILTIRRIR